MECGLGRIAVQLGEKVSLSVAAVLAIALSIDIVIEIPEVQSKCGIIEQRLQNPLVKVYEHTVPRRKVPVEVDINGEIGSAILDESATSVCTMESILAVKRAWILQGQRVHQLIRSPEFLAVDSELFATQALQSFSDPMGPDNIASGNEVYNGTLDVAGRRAALSNLAKEIPRVAGV
ncbi:hypothetical protein Mapa_004102 [Marchantia paleacea]|nr:hypothetical protein Mapa_004102 [Marchantia paleacea]